MVHVVVAEHPIYRKSGTDLLVDIPVSYTNLALGADIEFPHFNNEKIMLRIPPGTQSGSRFKVAGKGGWNPNGILGDLVVTLKVETVKTPDEKYRKVLEELAKFERENLDSRRAAWLKKTAPQPT
jgi:molecular chaperone DnaJ